jgi:PAS domain-containing protein
VPALLLRTHDEFSRSFLGKKKKTEMKRRRLLDGGRRDIDVGESSSLCVDGVVDANDFVGASSTSERTQANNGENEKACVDDDQHARQTKDDERGNGNSEYAEAIPNSTPWDELATWDGVVRFAAELAVRCSNQQVPTLLSSRDAVLAVNDSFVDWLGYSQQELFAMPVTELMPVQMRAKTLREFEKFTRENPNCDLIVHSKGLIKTKSRGLLPVSGRHTLYFGRQEMILCLAVLFPLSADASEKVIFRGAGRQPLELPHWKNVAFEPLDIVDYARIRCAPMLFNSIREAICDQRF